MLATSPAGTASTATTIATRSTAVISSPSKSVSSLRNSPANPNTPNSTGNVVKKPEFVTPPPGNFRHPQLTEIIRRQARNDFTKTNVQVAALNAAVVVATFVASGSLHSTINTVASAILPNDLSVGGGLVINLFRLLLLSNIIVALRPVLPYISKRDGISDIPLTPSQRALLGLPASRASTVASNEGTAKYITPPRYRRSSSSIAGTPQGYSTDRRSISANYSSSPLSTSRPTLGFSPSPQVQSSRRASGSPFLPSSPLLHKALGANASRSDLTYFADSTTSGFGMSTSGFGGLGRSQSLKERSRKEDDPGTPSPGSKRQPGLNYKWLYDKGYKMPFEG